MTSWTSFPLRSSGYSLTEPNPSRVCDSANCPQVFAMRTAASRSTLVTEAPNPSAKKGLGVNRRIDGFRHVQQSALDQVRASAPRLGIN